MSDPANEQDIQPAENSDQVEASQNEAVDKDALSPEDIERFGSEEGESELFESEQDVRDRLEGELASLSEQLLRAKADYANYTKIAERNVNTAREQTTLSLARSLVTVLDTFDLTLQQDAETIKPEDLMKGVEMVRDQLIKSLSNFGLKKIEPQVGEELDPNLHTALMRQPNEEVESGHITLVMQPGYVVNDKPVRPAQVAVAE